MELSELEKELQAIEAKRRELKDQIAAAENEFILWRFQEKRSDGRKFNGNGLYNPKTGKFKEGTDICGEIVEKWQ